MQMTNEVAALVEKLNDLAQRVFEPPTKGTESTPAMLREAADHLESLATQLQEAESKATYDTGALGELLHAVES